MLTRRLSATCRHFLLFLLAVVALAPVYLMITGSFKSQGEFLQHPWALPSSLDFEAYRTTFTDKFGNWLLNSVIVTVGAVGITMVVASLAAWGLVNWPFRGRDTVLGIVVSLMVVPPVVLLIPLFQVGTELGWISTFRIVILVYIGLMLPFSVYLLANFFKTIPASLLEAAALDGASPFQVFRRIVVPLSGPAVATLAVVNLLWAWNELLLALVFLQEDDKKTLMVGITGFQSRFSLDIPTIMSGMVVATLPLVAAYLFGQRYFIRGLTAGGIKDE
ncbi:ABC-type glycerol-3-phosphate transport system permease component [Mycobacterium frederiksbergense]|uniref:ABC-type glycerol-3-phosphate transport system permease component n=1 Tax=Mycolicibacterium frederiksbergense TaxID=117567 RepID=A0ABT6KVT4_9MYCO|nr:carbohydrate ABC transporter permease [Mycolicibacterium frederiksbergense]MDH6194718.1 ABC-type glycerol-3-phosphate transport system permease component [Mycolicibacterium frederiksbergense]